MTGRELVDYLRESILNDTVSPYLWTGPELLRGLNYGEVQACRRAHFLTDKSTANDNGTAATASTAGQRPLCALDVIAGTAEYVLSPKILRINRCQLSTMTYPLMGPLTYQDLDNLASGWRGTGGALGSAGEGGNPFGFMNEEGNKITLVLCPSASCTAYLEVSRLPLGNFTLDTSPEIPSQYHTGLADWAAHIAFLKRDSDAYNPELSNYYRDRFTDQFGPLPSAMDERRRKILSQPMRIRNRTFGS